MYFTHVYDPGCGINSKNPLIVVAASPPPYSLYEYLCLYTISSLIIISFTSIHPFIHVLPSRRQSPLLKAHFQFRRTHREMLSRPSLEPSTIIIICLWKLNIEIHDQAYHSGTEIHKGEWSAYTAIGTCTRESEEEESEVRDSEAQCTLTYR